MMNVKLAVSVACSVVGLLLAFVAICTPYWVKVGDFHLGLIYPEFRTEMIPGVVSLVFSTVGCAFLAWGSAKKDKASLRFGAGLLLISALALLVIDCIFAAAILMAQSQAGYSFILAILTVTLFFIGAGLAIHCASNQITPPDEMSVNLVQNDTALQVIY